MGIEFDIEEKFDIERNSMSKSNSISESNSILKRNYLKNYLIFDIEKGLFDFENEFDIEDEPTKNLWETNGPNELL